MKELKRNVFNSIEVKKGDEIEVSTTHPVTGKRILSTFLIEKDFTYNTVVWVELGLCDRQSLGLASGSLACILGREIE